MEVVTEAIGKLYASTGRPKYDRIEKLPQSGSDRIYFRIYSGNETCIATYNPNKKETKTFIYFSRHFIQAG